MNLEALWPFYAGMLVQAVFLLVGQVERVDVLKLIGCFVGSLVALIPVKHEFDYNLSLHLLAVSGVFSIGYMLCFKDKILERINKEILMVWTMVGLYVALQTPLITRIPAVITLLSVLSVLPIINAFVGFDKTFGWKAYFYIWFLCVLVGIAASKFAFSTVANILGFQHNGTPVDSLTAFFVGMSFLYLTVNLWYIVELIPISGKNQTFSERMEQVEEDLEMMASDYDDGQVRWWKTVLLLIVCGFLLAANYFEHFVSDETLVPLLIVLLPAVDKIKRPTKAPVQTIATADTGTGPSE